MFVTSSSRHILPTTVTFTLTLVLSLHCDGWRLLLLLLYFVHGTAGLQRDEKLRLSVYPCGACFDFVRHIFTGHSSNLHILPTTVTFTLTLRRLFVHFVDRGVANAAVNLPVPIMSSPSACLYCAYIFSPSACLLTVRMTPNRAHDSSPCACLLTGAVESGVRVAHGESRMRFQRKAPASGATPS